MRHTPAPRATVTLVAGLLAVACGCAPYDDDPECDDATVEDHFRFDPYTSELASPPHGVRTPGSFTAWEVGEVVFQRKGGEPHGFFLLLEGEGTLPDLLASPPPSRPAITAFGFDPPAAEPAEPLLRYGGVPGDLRLLAGNVELLEPLDGWTVRSPRDEETCRSFHGGGGWLRIKPVYVGRDGEERRLFPGDRAVFGQFEVVVVSAQSNNRNHPWAPCSTEVCPWEKLSWWISPLGAESLHL